MAHLLLQLFWWIQITNLQNFECFQKRNSKIIFKKIFLNQEIGLIRTTNFIIIINHVQRRLKLLHMHHYQIFWLSESHVFIKIATCGTLTFEPSKKTIRGNALCVQVWGVLLILELTFEFLAGKMLNSCNAFSIVESFKDEFVLAGLSIWSQQ